MLAGLLTTIVEYVQNLVAALIVIGESGAEAIANNSSKHGIIFPSLASVTNDAKGKIHAYTLSINVGGLQKRQFT